MKLEIIRLLSNTLIHIDICSTVACTDTIE